MSCTPVLGAPQRLLGACMQCRRERFTDDYAADTSIVHILEGLEKENKRLNQRLVTIEEMLKTSINEKEVSRMRQCEIIRVSAIEERQWQLEKDMWRKWKTEGMVRLMELEENVRGELRKMLEEKEGGEWEIGLTRGLALAYEICMKEEKEEGLSLMKMIMRGIIVEGDELCYKMGIRGKIVIGGMDIEYMDVGIQSDGDVYASMGAWIGAKSKKRIARVQIEKLAKEMLVVRRDKQLGNLLSLWEEDQTTKKVSATRRLLDAARTSFAMENIPRMLELAVKAEAMTRHGNAAAQQMRVLVAVSITGLADTSTIMPAATELLSRWAQVADFLRDFIEFVNKTCKSSDSDKSSGP